MAARVAVAIVLVVLLVAVAYWLERRRRRDAPTQAGTQPPAQLDRHDFPRAEAPWIVVLFTSATCESCAGLYDKAKPLESGEVAVFESEFPADRARHERYHIDAAPTTVVADADGVVRAALVGPFDAAELWSAMADARR